MRIGYIHLDYGEWTNGTYNAQEIGLAQAFESLGHKVYIFYWLNKHDSKCFSEVNLTSNIKKIYLPYRFRIAHHAIVDLDLLRSYKLDILHLQTDNLLYVPEAIYYCIKKNIKYYCYIGTIKSSNPNPIIRKILDRITLRNIKALKRSCVFAKTPAMAKELIALGVKNTIVAPVGLDQTVIPKEEKSKNDLISDLKISQNKTYILCVCALRHDKHPFDIFKLAELLDEKFCIIYIGGNGPLRENFINKLSEKESYNKIKYVGAIPNALIHSYYRIADYVVNFNPNEIFGMAILEAMYHNCNVIAIKAPGPECIIENNVSGFIVNSVEEMSKIIINRQKVENARQRVMTNFTWKKTASTILEQL